MDTLGRHVIAELDGCDPALLSQSGTIRGLLIEAAIKAGATVLADETFDFQNGGVSGFVLLSESHISIHTWPEHGYAAIDIYTCGRHTAPELACSHLADRLQAARVRSVRLDRGIPAAGGGHDQHWQTTGGAIPRPHFAKLPQSA